MDNEFLKRLVIIVVLLGVLVAMYYIASPYQNCMRELGSRNVIDTGMVMACHRATSW